MPEREVVGSDADDRAPFATAMSRVRSTEPESTEEDLVVAIALLGRSRPDTAEATTSSLNARMTMLVSGVDSRFMVSLRWLAAWEGLAVRTRPATRKRRFRTRRRARGIRSVRRSRPRAGPSACSCTAPAPPCSNRATPVREKQPQERELRAVVTDPQRRSVLRIVDAAASFLEVTHVDELPSVGGRWKSPPEVHQFSVPAVGPGPGEGTAPSQQRAEGGIHRRYLPARHEESTGRCQRYGQVLLEEEVERLRSRLSMR